jgi:hypothetical protein
MGPDRLTNSIMTEGRHPMNRSQAARGTWLAVSLLALFLFSLSACGISWYIGAKPMPVYVYVEEAGLSPSPTSRPPSPPPPPAPWVRIGGVYDAGYQNGNGTFYLTAGTSTPATVTVPAGSYVTMLSGSAGSGGTGTITITPAGPSITDAQINPPITLQANQSFTLGRPVLQGSPNELGAGSTIVFSSGIANYTVTLFYYGGS